MEEIDPQEEENATNRGLSKFKKAFISYFSRRGLDLADTINQYKQDARNY